MHLSSHHRQHGVRKGDKQSLWETPIFDPSQLGNPLKVICKGFSQNWWKLDSSCLLQYKCVCVIGFVKLQHEMLKMWSLMVILVSLAILWRQSWRHISMCFCVFCFRLRWDSLLFKEVIYLFTFSRTYLYFYQYACVLLCDRLPSD